MSNGLRDLAALAADDAAVERQLSDADRYDLAGYTVAWDDAVEAMEEQQTRAALVLPSWFVPVVIALVCIIAFAWSV